MLNVSSLRKVLTVISAVLLSILLLITVYKLWPAKVQEMIHRHILGKRHLGLVIEQEGITTNVWSLFGDCPLDVIGSALGLGLGDFILITDDPYSGQRIEIRVKDGKIDSLAPKQLFLFNGYACPYINFFTSEEHLKAWLADHPEIQGETMSVEEAFEYAKDLINIEKEVK